jgi:hypothetical protein
MESAAEKIPPILGKGEKEV